MQKVSKLAQLAQMDKIHQQAKLGQMILVIKQAKKWNTKNTGQTCWIDPFSIELRSC